MALARSSESFPVGGIPLDGTAGTSIGVHCGRASGALAADPGGDHWPGILRPSASRGEEKSMAVTGLANLAVKVADLDVACRFYETAGAEVRDRMQWHNGERADVFLGPVMITLFTRAIYEDLVALPAEGFLHPALFTDDLDSELEGHTVLWGPEVVEGAFGKRRIGFVAAPGGIRLEFMEQLEAAHDDDVESDGEPA